MGVGGRRCAVVWRKVRSGGGAGMGVEGRKFVGVGAGVRRCVEEGALRCVRAYGCGRAKVRRHEGEGAQRRVRWCG